MKKIFAACILFSIVLAAHPTYTAYSGGTGSKGFCASSCHGSGTGTISVTGIPTTYVPSTLYTVTVKHNGGSTISNFNASSRIGTTTSAAGVFTAGTNSAVYSVSGYENGVRASVNSIDEALFQWTAPAAGTGEVKIYFSGLQGSKNGTTTKLIISTTESTTDVAESKSNIGSFELKQNYPNPFNPTTTISFQIPLATSSHSPFTKGETSVASGGFVSLTVFDIIGNEVATLVNEKKEPGNYSITFDGTKLSTGIYFARLQCGDNVQMRKMLLVK